MGIAAHTREALSAVGMAVSAWERRGGVAVGVLPRLQKAEAGGFSVSLINVSTEFAPLYEPGASFPQFPLVFIFQ